MTAAYGAGGALDTRAMHQVELSLAADVQMLVLARMTAAAVATRADFDVEQVEDLRLAIDELCIRLVQWGNGQERMTLTFQWDDEGLVEVVGVVGRDGHPSGNGHGAASVKKPSYELAERILEALVDEHGGDTVDGVRRVWLRVRRRGQMV